MLAACEVNAIVRLIRASYNYLTPCLLLVLALVGSERPASGVAVLAMVVVVVWIPDSLVASGDAM